jgi:hypothetical protein
LESPQSNPKSMSGDFGARRGAETARGQPRRSVARVAVIVA